MRHLLFLCLLSFYIPLSFSQSNYFQQEVNYKIDVTLDDKLHTLSGNIAMEYTNNSPDALEYIFIHLWPNGYSNKNTAYAKQTLSQGNDNFHFAEAKDLGSITELDFKVNGTSCTIEKDKVNRDIVKVLLSKPLQSGETTTITTPFEVKIPKTTSRMGRYETSYQLTQWYPKPAVYDQEGWHPMPYLESGEYYSEFGSFDVSITLPRNYVVGATGVLQTETEYEFLDQRIAMTDDFIKTGFPDTLNFPNSSLETKTIRYTAERVHDFAWFADKRFHVQKGTVLLDNGKAVTTWAMFTNSEAEYWKDGTKFLNRSVKFYSDNVGDYPYPQATAIEGPLFAGGAMEYPMITVVASVASAQELDRLITHEVGHNWFYGILATNERDYPWMDEGMNSFYESRYMNTFYEDGDADMISKGAEKFLGNGHAVHYDELAYLYLARRHLDQAPHTTSADLNQVNYGVGAYMKPALIFKMLEGYVGKSKFDEAMQSYFQQWQFKHPQPKDFRSIIESVTEKKLDWLFDGLLYSNKKMDYALVDVNANNGAQIKVKNKGEIITPFPVSGIKNGEVVATQWYEGFEGEKDLDFPAGDYDLFRIDAERVTLDVNRRNNNRRLKGPVPGIEPLNLKFLTSIDNPTKTTFHWTPVVGVNAYDGFMVGLSFYNNLVPERPLQMRNAMFFGTNSKDIARTGNIKYNFYPKGKAVQQVAIGWATRRFNFNYNESNDYFLAYLKRQPYIHVEFGRKATSNTRQYLDLRSIILTEDQATFDTTGTFAGTEKENSLINEIRYTLERNTVVNPFRFQVALEQQSYDRKILTTTFNESYLKASVEMQTAYTYKANKHVSLRIFAGYFLNNTRRNAGNVANRGTRGSFALTSQGFNDYKYDDFFFGRSENEGFLSQQIMIREGGMKNAFGSSFKTGVSNDYIVAFNLKADLPQDLPLKLPIKPYFDIGYFHNAQPTGASDTFRDQLLWSGGVMLELKGELFKDPFFAIYFPLVNSDNINLAYDSATGGKYFSRVTFTLNLHALNPWKAVNRLF